MKILIGNAFPLTLIRRKVVIDKANLSELQSLASHSEIYSFWGHENTLKSAIKVLGFDISPLFGRIPVELNDENYPVLFDIVFKECWILSPNFKENFRPKIGEEVSEDLIIGWNTLKISWL